MRFAAPAKINLTLEVLGRRPDGYHDLRTLMLKVPLGDELDLEPRPNGLASRFTEIVNLTGRPLPPEFAGPRNLILKALELYQRAAGTSGGFDIRLVKRIPCGAGLGGGSSDGAAVLAFLNALNSKTPLNEQELAKMALKLGADVPFFLWPEKTAWAEGVGEILSPGPVLGPAYLLLINPGGHLDTGEVFQSLSLTELPLPIKIPKLFITADSGRARAAVFHQRDVAAAPKISGKGALGPAEGQIRAPADLGRNDLLTAAAKLNPAVESVAQWLARRLAAGRGADNSAGRAGDGRAAWGMSGSGPTFWVMTENRDIVADIKRRGETRGDGWWFHLTAI